NADLAGRICPSSFEDEHYRLFQRYLESRHRDGGMAGADRDEYLEFLASDWAETSFVEFRQGDELVAVAIVDKLDDGLSAVYTFFDPAEARRSAGTYAVLWQIAEARRLGLDWLYLGFWVGACRKMSYKEQFRPLEALIDGSWRLFEKGEKIRG
ncbi:MAG: putative arginyl-tRNA--protein transferase, partial [Proteobacteria bacterium]|nr:putative arginyl-tRNA--protein transferase [Pseudomonadota bacterium]